MVKLQATYNNDANKIVRKNAIKNLNFLINLATVISNPKPVPEEPKTFTQAWNYPNTNSCTKWHEAICKEFADMNKQQV